MYKITVPKDLASKSMRAISVRSARYSSVKADEKGDMAAYEEQSITNNSLLRNHSKMKSLASKTGSNFNFAIPAQHKETKDGD